MLTTLSADTHRTNDKTLHVCECVLHVHIVHPCCGLQAGAFSFGLSNHQHEKPTLYLLPFGTLRIDPTCRNQNGVTACSASTARS